MRPAAAARCCGCQDSGVARGRVLGWRQFWCHHLSLAQPPSVSPLIYWVLGKNSYLISIRRGARGRDQGHAEHRDISCRTVCSALLCCIPTWHPHKTQSLLIFIKLPQHEELRVSLLQSSEAPPSTITVRWPLLTPSFSQNYQIRPVESDVMFDEASTLICTQKDFCSSGINHLHQSQTFIVYLTAGWSQWLINRNR